MDFTKFLVFASLSVLTAGLPAYFKDCGSKEGVIESVTVSGCKDSDPICPLKKGTTIFVSIGFKSNEVITNATAVVHGVLAGVPIPFPLPQSDGCKSGLSCPVKQGASVVYKSEIPVLKSFPSLQVVVEWELKDQSKVDIFCAAFKSEIVS